MISQRPRGLAVIQHYVPKFFLREFSSGKKEQLWVYDKQTNKQYQTNVKNAAAERDFYNYEVEGSSRTLEPKLAQLESKAKHVLHGVLRKQSISHLTSDDRVLLSIFMALQFARTNAARQFLRSAADGIYEAMKSKGQGNADWLKAIDEFVGDGLTEEKRRQFEVEHVDDAPRTYAPHFLSKNWVLCRTDARQEFLLGDNPVCLQNSQYKEGFHTMGLASKGIEIYMPLSPRLSMMLMCPSHMEALNWLALNGGEHFDDYSKRLYRSAVTGNAFHFDPENVTNVNSLQVMASERYVFARTPRFDLVQDMVNYNSRFRRGFRPVVA